MIEAKTNELSPAGVELVRMGGFAGIPERNAEHEPLLLVECVAAEVKRESVNMLDDQVVLGNRHLMFRSMGLGMGGLWEEMALVRRIDSEREEKILALGIDFVYWGSQIVWMKMASGCYLRHLPRAARSYHSYLAETRRHL